jgi:hypothetical protein
MGGNLAYGPDSTPSEPRVRTRVRIAGRATFSSRPEHGLSVLE